MRKDFEPYAGEVRRGLEADRNGRRENGFSEFLAFSEPDPKQNPIFPVEELPPELRGFAFWASESLQTAVDMPAVSALAAASLCVQKKFKVHVQARHYEPTNLYLVTVANPSERKSPTIALAMGPVHRYQKEENDRRRPLVEEYQTRRDLLQRRIEALTKNAASGKKAKNDSPAAVEDVLRLRRELRELEKEAVHYISLIADDITMEALTSKMAANGEKMALVSSEGGIFNILSGLYTGGVTNIDLILKAWSGDYVSVDRKGRPPEELLSPSLVVNLMVQPNVLEAVMGNVEFSGKGLNARFLYAIPASKVGGRSFRAPDIPREVLEEYDALLRELLEIPDTEEPRIIELTDEARGELEKIHNAVEPRLAGDLEPLGGWGGKYEGTVARIAGLLHICGRKGNAAAVPIPGETVRQAGRIGAYFLAHALTAWQMAGQSDDPAAKDAKYILGRLDSSGKTEIGRSELQQLCKDRKGMEAAERFAAGLEVLAKRGYIRMENDPGSKNAENAKKGGRPRSPTIYVNPIYTNRKERCQ